MIVVADDIRLDDRDIVETFIRASGPGGQNVNKVATAVQLRFDVRHSAALSEAVRRRLETLSGSRLTKDGVLVITARRHRSQDRNREDAMAELARLIRLARTVPEVRHATRPTLGSRLRRLETKQHRAGVKRNRNLVRPID